MAEKKQGNTVSVVWDLAKPIAEKLGLNLWDVRFQKEGAVWYLRIFIDKPSGVTIEDCEAMSRAIDEPLDKLDPIEQNYCLEVSSPGIERDLIRDEHFEEFLGAPIMVKLIRPNENGVRELKGTLIAHDKDSVTLMLDGNEKTTIQKKNTVYIKLDDFLI